MGADIITSFGFLFLAGVLAWLIYQIGRSWKGEADLEDTYNLLEEVGVEKMAKKKGINLFHELEKRRMQKGNRFRRRVEQAVYEELFGKDKE